MGLKEGSLIVLSRAEVAPLREAYTKGVRQMESSPDLGKTRVEVALTSIGVHYPTGDVLQWGDVTEILRHPNACFCLQNGRLSRLQIFSPLTGRLVALYSTGTAPTMTLSGIPMHRIQDTTPWQDAAQKVQAARPTGRVLDTCMGLGYTAILAAHRADRVLTVELDPAVIWLARQNPWSAAVFTASNVTTVQADIRELVTGLPEGYFSTVLHDPPVFSLAGELYSEAFYRQIRRLLRPHGRLFHYVGNPESKMGRSTTRQVVRRLYNAGFRQVRPAKRAFGLLAFK